MTSLTLFSGAARKALAPCLAMQDDINANACAPPPEKSAARAKLKSGDILAPWYFEMFCFELAQTSQKATLRHITFLMALSQYGHEWIAGSDLWRDLGCKTIFPLNGFLPLLEKLNCVEVDRGMNGRRPEQVHFRIRREVHLVKLNSLNGSLMSWMFSALQDINLRKPRVTPRIGLLLFAVLARKLVRRSDIDDYLGHSTKNAQHVVGQIKLLIKLNLITELKNDKRRHDRHYLLPVRSDMTIL
jgi:hypothetical protein